jgi:hypothetical protein
MFIYVIGERIIFNEAGLQVAVVRDLGQEVEINSGVKRGDQVSLSPAIDLAEGSRLRTRPGASQTSNDGRRHSCE